jgi:hypothetical protein
MQSTDGSDAASDDGSVVMELGTAGGPARTYEDRARTAPGAVPGVSAPATAASSSLHVDAGEDVEAHGVMIMHPLVEALDAVTAALEQGLDNLQVLYRTTHQRTPACALLPVP